MKFIESLYDWLLVPIRSYNRKKVKKWREDAIERTLHKVLPEDRPWQYRSAPSFLQDGKKTLKCLYTIDVFLHTVPMAIDFLGPGYYNDFRSAQYYVSRKEWEGNQRELIFKRERLTIYGCPYKIFWYHESSNDQSIKYHIIQ